MRTKLLICLGVLLSVAAAVQEVGWPLARLTVRVIDEQRKPISDAKIRIGFREKLSDKDVRAEGETDANGEFTAEGYSDMKLLSDGGKQGYYSSGSPGTIFKGQSLGKWQPWNPVEEIILRPIGKPVALYAKRVQVEIPVLDQPCGYDLAKGDWVAPHSKGSTSDFIFTAHREFKARRDFDVRVDLSFSNPHDGLLKTSLPTIGKNSVFKWERDAPQVGYTQGVQLRNAVQGITFINTFEHSDVFFYRVRTVEENGRIIAANYGKISGGLRLDGMNSKTCTVLFTYYLNPESLDQNLEWDTKLNLLQGLSADQMPREP